jgi:Domain of Unknown Function (DUF1259)
VKPALDLIGKSASRPAATTPAPAAAPATTIDRAKLAEIVGTPGEQTGAVYKITLGRDDLKTHGDGGAHQRADGPQYVGGVRRDERQRAVAGDVAMLANEVQPVLKALRKDGIDVVT